MKRSPGRMSAGRIQMYLWHSECDVKNEGDDTGLRALVLKKVCFKQWNTLKILLILCGKVANMRIKIDKFKISLKRGKISIYIQNLRSWKCKGGIWGTSWTQFQGNECSMLFCKVANLFNHYKVWINKTGRKKSTALRVLGLRKMKRKRYSFGTCWTDLWESIKIMLISALSEHMYSGRNKLQDEFTHSRTILSHTV